MKRSAVVGVHSDCNRRRAGYRAQSDGSDPVVASLLCTIEIDIEFEELEQKTAPQSDTTYLDWMSGRS